MTDEATTIAKNPEWQRERLILLQGICEELATAISNGATRKLAARLVCQAHGRIQLSGGRPLPLSAATLLRWFDRWESYGRAMSAFEYEYKPGQSRVSMELVVEFQRLTTLPGMTVLTVAYRELVRRWKNGDAVPGLGNWREWWQKNHAELAVPDAAPEFPVSERTMLRYKTKKNLRALGNKGIAAFRQNSFHITRTSADLRPCELFVLDDHRPDILVLDDESGLVTDVCIYLMQEVGCRRIVGFTCRPAKAMNSTDVDALIARVLEAEGYGEDYVTHILLERGTVAMSPAAQQLIEAVTDGKVKIHRTGMDGGVRALGFAADRPSGHWQGKGTMEAFCGKIDKLCMMLPGQRGNKYENQPANLAWSMRRKYVGENGVESVRTISGGEAAEAEALGQAEVASGKRLGFDCGLLWASQFNQLLRDIIKEHNASRDHEYEGFGQVTQFSTTPGVWEDQPNAISM